MPAVGVLQAPVLALAGLAVMWAVKSPELGVTASPQSAGRWALAGGGAGRSPLAGTDLQRQPGPQDKGRGSAPQTLLAAEPEAQGGGSGGPRAQGRVSTPGLVQKPRAFLV